MMKRTRVVVAAATLAAVAATGATSASAAGPSPSKPDTKPGAVKGPGKPDARIAAMAAKLGITTDRLMEALVAAKTSLAGSDQVTLEQFATAVAANLGMPVGTVTDAVAPLFLEPRHDKKPGTKDGDDPGTSPLLSDAAAAAFASALGVDQAKAKAALAELVKIGSKPKGIDVNSKDFAAVAASLGVTTDQLKDALGMLKQTLDH